MNPALLVAGVLLIGAGFWALYGEREVREALREIHKTKISKNRKIAAVLLAAVGGFLIGQYIGT